MSRRRDPELEDIFGQDPGLEGMASLLGAGRLKPPPLDPGFRHALRRELMTQAYDRYHRRQGPNWFASLFNGPRMAAVTVLVGAVLVGLLLVANGNLLSAGPVTVSTVGPTKSVAVTQPIQVSFSQPMDHQSVEQAIQIEPATQVTYTWQGNNLIIQPVTGNLAPNTQYHVSVGAAAKTEPGKPLGQTATVAVTTAPLPSPSPTVAPSPTPAPPPVITAELDLPATSGTVVGFTSDASALLFLTPSGDLDQIGADGSGLKTIHAGVSSASLAPNASALAYTVTGEDGGVFLAGVDGSNAQRVDPRDSARVIGWLEGKPFLLAGADLGPAGGASLAKLPSAVAEAALSPDGKRVIAVRAIPAYSQAASPSPVPSPSPATPILFTIASQLAVNWTVAGQDFSWSPDSSRIAFWSAGSLEVAAPDGSSPVTLAKATAPLRASFTDDGRRLLFGAPDGAWVVGADGSDLHQLSKAAFQGPVWAPGDTRFAFGRGGTLWIDQVSLAGGKGLDLNAAAAVVDSYERTRLAGDLTTAGGLLGPSASPVAPSPESNGIHLARYFVISSEATASEARFTVRLVYAKGTDEVRYQDEQLVIVPTSAGLKIGSVSEGPVQLLGKGPTVNSIAVSPDHLLLVFDSDLDPAAIQAAGSLVLSTADGQAVPVTVEYEKRQLMVSAKLVAGQKYVLALSNAVKDIAGQQLQGGYQYQFVAPASD